MFEIVMGVDDFLIQLVKYCGYKCQKNATGQERCLYSL